MGANDSKVANCCEVGKDLEDSCPFHHDSQKEKPDATSSKKINNNSSQKSRKESSVSLRTWSASVPSRFRAGEFSFNSQLADNGNASTQHKKPSKNGTFWVKRVPEEKVVRYLFPVYYVDALLTTEDIADAESSWDLIGDDKSPEWSRYLAKHPDTKHRNCMEWFQTIFYERLFDVHPISKKMFSNARVQGVFLVALISFIFSAMEYPKAFRERLEHLAVTHCKKGVKALEYGIIGEVMFWSLQTCLGSGAYTLRIHEAWVKLFSAMLRIIVPVAVKLELGDGAPQRARMEKVQSYEDFIYKEEDDAKLANDVRRFTEHVAGDLGEVLTEEAATVVERQGTNEETPLVHSATGCIAAGSSADGGDDKQIVKDMSVLGSPSKSPREMDIGMPKGIDDALQPLDACKGSRHLKDGFLDYDSSDPLQQKELPPLRALRASQLVPMHGDDNTNSAMHLAGGVLSLPPLSLTPHGSRSEPVDPRELRQTPPPHQKHLLGCSEADLHIPFLRDTSQPVSLVSSAKGSPRPSDNILFVRSHSSHSPGTYSSFPGVEVKQRSRSFVEEPHYLEPIPEVVHHSDSKAHGDRHRQKGHISNAISAAVTTAAAAAAMTDDTVLVPSGDEMKAGSHTSIQGDLTGTHATPTQTPVPTQPKGMHFNARQLLAAVASEFDMESNSNSHPLFARAFDNSESRATNEDRRQESMGASVDLSIGDREDGN